MTIRQSAAAERGVRLITSGSDTSTDGIVCSAVSPRLTEWVPELLTALRPRSQQTVRQHATSDDPFRASSAILSAIHPEWTTTTDTWSDDTAEAVAYTRAITALALTYVDDDPDGVSAYHRERYADLIDTVESVGTGRGPVNGDLGALAKGPVALHRDLDDDPQPLTLLLDGEAWTELTDRRTGVRALAAIAILGDGFDVRVVASPALQRELTRRYPRWSAIHLDLTADRDRSRRGGRRSRNQEVPTDAHPAWTALDGLAATPGKRRLLGNLTATHGRRYQDLEHDHAIGIEAGTVSRYVLDLENRGLVTVDRRGQHNTVRLSDRGETAVTQFLDADNELVHPDQCRLDTGLTETLHESTSTVSPRREGHREDTPTPIDEWVAATGDPDGEAEYVQWLQPPDGSLDTQSIHRRFAAAARGDGVTLVDDHLTPFDDGRVTYLSHHTNEAVVVAQWGGPLATLGRLAAALLSDKALSKILTPSRVGREFASIHDGVTDHDPDERFAVVTKSAGSARVRSTTTPGGSVSQPFATDTSLGLLAWLGVATQSPVARCSKTSTGWLRRPPICTMLRASISRSRSGSRIRRRSPPTTIDGTTSVHSSDTRCRNRPSMAFTRGIGCCLKRAHRS